MKKFEKIQEKIKEYQQKADALFEKFSAEEAKARQRFSEVAFNEEMLNMFPKYAGQIRAEADWTVREIEEIFNEIEDEFQSWIVKPIPVDFLQMLSAIKDYGIKLSMPELKVFESKTKGSYFGNKLFAEVARENGYFVKVADMPAFLQLLNSARSDASLAVLAYSGSAPDYIGKELINDWEFEGVKQGRYQSFHMYFAYNFLKTENSIVRAEKMWESTSISVEYTLTEEEKKKIKEVEDVYKTDPELAKKRLDDLMMLDSDFLNKMELSGGELYNVFNRYIQTGNFNEPNDEFGVTHI